MKEITVGELLRRADRAFEALAQEEQYPEPETDQSDGDLRSSELMYFSKGYYEPGKILERWCDRAKEELGKGDRASVLMAKAIYSFAEREAETKDDYQESIRICEDKIREIQVKKEEEARLEAEKQQLAENVERSIRRKEKIKKIAIYASLAIIPLVIIGFMICNSVNEMNHAPEKIECHLLQKENVIENDREQIELTVSYTAHGTGVDTMDFIIYLYGSNGKKLGYLRATGISVDAQHGQTVNRVLVWESSNDSGAFYQSVYDSDISDLTYEFQITGIRFSDGTVYRPASISLKTGFQMKRNTVRRAWLLKRERMGSEIWVRNG